MSQEMADSLPVLQTMEDVKRRFNGKGENCDLKEALCRVGGLISPGSTLQESLIDTAFHEVVEPAVFDHLSERATHKTGEGAPQNSGACFPSSLRPSIPWPGARFPIWTDGKLMLLGEAADAAFKDTYEECVRQAQQEDSPYRKAGLSEAEAAETEGRRIDRQKDRRRRRKRDSLGRALPAKKGEQVGCLGHLWDAEMGGVQALFDKRVDRDLMAPSPEKTVLWARADKLEMAVQYVESIAPGARRQGKLRFHHHGSAWSRPIEIHLGGHSLKEGLAQWLKETHPEGAAPPPSLVGLLMPTSPRAQDEKLWQKIPDRLKSRARQGSQSGMADEENTATRSASKLPQAGTKGTTTPACEDRQLDMFEQT